MIKKHILTCIIIGVILIFPLKCFAADPYNNYSYDFNGNPQKEPQAYIPYEVITGDNLQVDKFNNPQDIVVSDQGNIYIADTGNNRIIILNNEFELVRIIKDFQSNNKVDSFNAPTGLYVTKENDLYIADSLNERIVVLDNNGSLTKIYGRPISPLIKESYVYRPLKVAVDSYKRLYIVADNQSSGIIELDADGSFLGFYGAIQTPPDPFKIYQRLFMTKEQKKRISLTIPTIYANVDMDSADFVYGTVGTIDPNNFSPTMFIHKLNPMGTDVLNRFAPNPPMGDVWWNFDESSEMKYYSFLCDVAVGNYGIYSVLDSRMGRIFTYDNDGNLLYIFGGAGSNFGQFGIPSAIDNIHDNNFIVVDSKYNQLLLFKPTKYGDLINQATVVNYNNDYENIEQYWTKALKYTAKSELVFDGMGQALFLSKNYVESMNYLRLANDRKLYSQTFVEYRSIVMAKYFGTVMTILFVVLILFLTLYIFYKYKKRNAMK